MPELINWNIAKQPANWIKIGIMAAIFCFAAELICSAVMPDSPEPAPNIMP